MHPRVKGAKAVATESGGAFRSRGSLWLRRVTAGTILIDQTTMNANAAGATPGNGGALHLTGAGDVTVNRSVVNDNTAASEGGGLWNSGAGTLTGTNTSVTSNTVGLSANVPNVFQKGPVAGGTFTVNGTLIAAGPNALAFA